jgi:hypothetical protein
VAALLQDIFRKRLGPNLSSQTRYQLVPASVFGSFSH